MNTLVSRGVRNSEVLLYMFIYMFVDQKNILNRTLEINSPFFQTFAVGFLIEFIDKSTTAFSRNAFLVE